MGGHRPYLVARERDWVLARIAEKPNLTLRALLKELADRGLVVSYYALWHFLHHEERDVQKSLRASEQDRPDVARRRERWRARQETIDPRRLVFIDETWAKTNMTRTPWPMRQRRTPRRQRPSGDAANPHVPGGAALRRAHRALRHRRPDQWRKLPRLCRAGSPPGPRARRHCLSWTTSEAYKGRAVRAAIRAAKAKLLFLPAYSPDLNPIEQAFAKIKTLRCGKADARTIEQTWRTIGSGCSTASPRQNAQITSPTQDMLRPKQIAL